MSRPAEDWKKWYAALRDNEPAAYKQAIEHAEGIVLTHHLGSSAKLSADIEVSHVILACSLLGIHP